MITELAKLVELKLAPERRNGGSKISATFRK
jgi:hypothetical protein